MRRPPLLVIAAVVTVTVAALVLKPSQNDIIWERLRARPESVSAQAAYVAAERQDSLSIPSGAYTFTDQRGRAVMRATLILPRGAGPNPTPFWFTVSVTTHSEESRAARGVATLRGHLLTLRPDRPSWLLLSEDHSLIQHVAPGSFTIATPGSDRTSTFTRREP